MKNLLKQQNQLVDVVACTTEPNAQLKPYDRFVFTFGLSTAMRSSNESRKKHDEITAAATAGTKATTQRYEHYSPITVLLFVCPTLSLSISHIIALSKFTTFKYV